MSEITGNISANEMYCFSCGKVILKKAVVCPYCGLRVVGVGMKGDKSEISSKSRASMFLLCFLFGWLGVHRFYAGKIGTGFLWLFTLGLLGIGVIVDMIFVIIGSFKDSEGKKIMNWDLV